MSDQALLVAEHYNQRRQIDTRQRKDSPIFQLKAFNNWIKACLLGRFIRHNDSVLDLCCGKGGDLQKYTYLRVSRLVGVDIAATSIKHAQERAQQQRNQVFACSFYAGDCFEEDINELIPMDKQQKHCQLFDVVSIQFALHYAFESERKLSRLLDNIEKSLRPGGYLIGTLADGQSLTRRLIAEQPDERASEERILSFGNNVYHVEFTNWPPLPGEDSDMFGRQYRFRLTDAIDDCPEYLSDRQTLERMASDRGLELIFYCGFHEFYLHQIQSQANQETWRRMRVLTSDHSQFPSDQWEVAEDFRQLLLAVADQQDRRGSHRDSESNSKIQAPQKQVNKSKHPFTNEAIMIREILCKVKELLRKNLKSYLRLDRCFEEAFTMRDGVGAEEEAGGEWSDQQRAELDKQCTVFLQSCLKRINNLRKAITELSSLPADENPSLREHWDVVVLSLEQQLSNLSAKQRDQQLLRCQQLESSDYTSLIASDRFTAERESILRRRRSSKSNVLLSSTELASSGKSLLPTDHSSHSKQRKPASTLPASDLQQSPPPQALQQEQQFDERMVLEQENDQLLEELLGLETEVKQAEKTLLEISQLQSTLETHVVAQSEEINRLYDESIRTTDTVRSGNQQLKKVTQSGVELRNFMILFMLIMSFTLLFLHWYD